MCSIIFMTEEEMELTLADLPEFNVTFFEYHE